MNSLIHLLEVTTLILVGVLIIQVSRCYLNFTRMEQAQSQLKGAKNSRSLSVRINIASSERSEVVPGVYRKPIEAERPSKVLPDPIEQDSRFTASATSTPSPAPQATSSAPQTTAPQTTSSAQRDTVSQQDQVQEKLSRPAASSNGQILNDYIGEFFTESVQADIEAFRKPVESVGASLSDVAAFEPEESIASEALDKSVTEKDNDEIIVVESHVKKIKPVILGDESLETDDLPILTEIAQASDLVDDDSVITVLSEQDGGEAGEKVMSDKVVHAMLDEARLVCAS